MHNYAEAISIAIVVLFWIISGLIRGFKWVLRQTGVTQAPPLPQAPPRSPAPPVSRTPAPFQAPPPARTPVVRTEQSRRQPAAGGPAVPEEATRRDFERQEQELFTSEAAGLNTPLTSASSRTAAQPNSLFGGTDDLVRAIILQEVLGPPLSRRTTALSTPPASSKPPASPQ